VAIDVPRLQVLGRAAVEAAAVTSEDERAEAGVVALVVARGGLPVIEARHAYHDGRPTKVINPPSALTFACTDAGRRFGRCGIGAHSDPSRCSLS
jgi:hypothetical protein